MHINSTIPASPRHAVFHYFLSEDIKQDAATTTVHSKRLLSLLKNKQVLKTSLSTIWKNTDGCAEQYICFLCTVSDVSDVTNLLHYN